MSVPFDHIASQQDSRVVSGLIAQLQRKVVWEYLETITPQLPGFEILELNGGTSDEALLFSDKGLNLVATDVSEEMMKLTTQKDSRFSLSHKVSSHYVDLDNFNETLFDKKFDLIFANFGAINGIDPLTVQKLLQKIPSLLTNGGRFIAIITPKFCLWESAYSVLRFQLRRVFRRYTRLGVLIDSETSWKTWYYSPRQIKKWAPAKFILNQQKPIGFMLPPSRLNKSFCKNKRLILVLAKIEKRVNRFSWLAGMADRFIIDFIVK